MSDPTFTQGLEATPAVVRAQRHGEQVTEFTIEVGEAALRVGDGADVDIRQSAQAFGKQAQDGALAGAGVAVNEREAAFADLRVFDTPAELFDAGGEVSTLLETDPSSATIN